MHLNILTCLIIECCDCEWQTGESPECTALSFIFCNIMLNIILVYMSFSDVYRQIVSINYIISCIYSRELIEMVKVSHSHSRSGILQLCTCMCSDFVEAQ